MSKIETKSARNGLQNTTGLQVHSNTNQGLQRTLRPAPHVYIASADILHLVCHHRVVVVNLALPPSLRMLA